MSQEDYIAKLFGAEEIEVENIEETKETLVITCLLKRGARVCPT